MTHTITVTYKYYQLVNDEWEERTGSVSKRFSGECDESKVLTANTDSVGQTIQARFANIDAKHDLEYDPTDWFINATQKNDNEEFIDPSTGENAADQANAKNAAETPADEKPADVKDVNNASLVNTSTPPSISIEDYIRDNIKSHAAWDPRLQRFDEYFDIPTEPGRVNPVRIPFANNTVATAFADLTNVMEKGLGQALYANKQFANGTYADNMFGQGYSDKNTSNSESSDSKEKTTSIQGDYASAAASEKFITHDTNTFMNDNNGLFWGAQSIVNPYSLTKLVGGIKVTGGNQVENYMYDIRDQRRFYSISGNTNDVLAISNPTVTQLINWSNTDQWGRTPYSFQDFVYCKYFGLIPNNRLITLRRYAAPTYDNLQFENMFGAQETTTTDSKGNKSTETNNANMPEAPSKKTFSPVAYVVTWFGGDTGNSLANLMNFTTGIKWGEVKSGIFEVSGEQEETKQSVIDRLLENSGHTNLFHDAELTSLNKYMHGASIISAKVASFGKFALAATGDIGISQDAYDKLMGANVDPYDSTFKNRVKGPINRIDTVKKREPGIEFSQQLTIKCAYKAKAIGGINPKAALLDVLGNCLEMVSPHALFWGGGHRYMIKPKIYPFHDGGWRDSFMAKIYDGKFLGKNGAIGTVLSGIKKVGTPDGGGEFNMDTLKETLKGSIGFLAGALSGISNMFGGVNLLDSLAGKLGGTAEQHQSGENVIKNFKKNLQQMWSNKMMAETQMPSINAAGNILVGEPVGEWHLTVGNPLNPIMVIGNLICKDMKVTWDEELGPDDFPTGFAVEYSLEHAMARDSGAIQSMFNRGMGKFYTLPDYISTASERITYVDQFTKNAGKGDVGSYAYKFAGDIQKTNEYKGGYKTVKIDPGSTPANAGNYETQLLTPFTPINGIAQRSIASLRNNTTAGITARVKSLAATRKFTNN